MAHDIFISYRRDGGEDLAGRVKDALKSRGFSVFMDVEDLKSGKFDTALFKKIEEATDVIVVLTAGCLDRCKNDDDWLRQEIRHALKCEEKNIVPIIARGFKMPPAATLPLDIAELMHYNGLTPAHELFDASIDRLVSTFLKSRPREIRDPLRKESAVSGSGQSVGPSGLVVSTLGIDAPSPDTIEQLRAQGAPVEALDQAREMIAGMPGRALVVRLRNTGYRSVLLDGYGVHAVQDGRQSFTFHPYAPTLQEAPLIDMMFGDSHEFVVELEPLARQLKSKILGYSGKAQLRGFYKTYDGVEHRSDPVTLDLDTLELAWDSNSPEPTL